MVTPEFTKSRALTWAMILTAWTLIVLTFAVQAYVFAVSRGRPGSFWHEFLVASSECDVEAKKTARKMMSMVTDVIHQYYGKGGPISCSDVTKVKLSRKMGWKLIRLKPYEPQRTQRARRI